MKILKKIIILLLIVFVIAQFFGPDKNEGDIVSIEDFFEDTNPPEDIKLILKQNCFDCHTSFTRYPWYSNITPVNYWMANHVSHGNEELNISNWNDYTIKKKDHKFEELIEMVEEKEMPLPSYTWTHREAKLTDEQIESLVTWAKQTRSQYSSELKSE